jgi:signal transduction histidine kinase
MRVTSRQKALIRRFGTPLGVGVGIFGADHLIDLVVDRLHLSEGVSIAEDVLLALLVAGIVYVLQQRFELASAQLKHFASDIAHQLRTPLAIQRSVGELGLQRSMSTVQYQDTLESMLEETHNLIRLVEALLLIAQMDSGQIRLARTRIQLSDLVLEVTGELDVLVQEKSQTLTIDASDDTLVEVDRAMLRQALINILGNAIKYTPNGGVIAVTTRASSFDCVEITVSDNGPGIDLEDQDRVFERFYRACSDRDGTGLGLAVSKWIVEAHNGKISCKSRVGEGSQFTVRIPA